MELFNLETIQPTDAVRERNARRAGTGHDYRCMVCSLPVNTESPKTVWVHMSGHGNLYPSSVSCEEAESLPEGSMYMQPVGPECAKKIPVEYKEQS